MDTGHIGIFVSGKTQKELVPKIVEFIGKRDGSSKGPGRKKPATTARRKEVRQPQEPGVSGSGNP